MSRQPEEQNQGVDAFSVFRFPENGKASGKASVQKASVQKASWGPLWRQKERCPNDALRLPGYTLKSLSLNLS